MTSARSRWCQRHFRFNLISETDLGKSICFDNLEVGFSNFYLRKETTKYMHNQSVAELVNYSFTVNYIFSVQELISALSIQQF